MNRKISQLPAATGFSDTDLLEIVRFAQSQKLTARQLREYVETGLGTAAKEDAQVAVDDNGDGRLLASGAFGWNGGFAILKGSGTNINDLQTSGIYALNSIYSGGYPGVTEPVYIRVTAHGSTYIKQEMMGITSNFCASRNMTEGDWYPWVPLYTQENAVGSVKRGAILERGSNANGDYIKFLDGTMLTWGIQVIDAVVAPGQSTSWDSSQQPMPFVGTVVSSVEIAYFTQPSGGGAAIYTVMQNYGLVGSRELKRAALNTGNSPSMSHPGFTIGELSAGSYAVFYQSTGRWK